MQASVACPPSHSLPTHAESRVGVSEYLLPQLIVIKDKNKQTINVTQGFPNEFISIESLRMYVAVFGWPTS